MFQQIATYGFFYLLIGVIITALARYNSGAKQTVEWYLGGVLFWPIVVILTMWYLMKARSETSTKEDHKD